MTCRHLPGDPDCSSTKHGYKAREIEAERNRELLLKSITPDANNYQVIQVFRHESHLVLKVKYPSCTNCSFEGTKVLVFLNVTEEQVLMWRRIDPHFRDPKSKNAFEAPSPAARFPASAEGWNDAVNYVQSKHCSR